MIGHAEPLDRVHIRGDPEPVEVLVVVDHLHDAPELRAVPIGDRHHDARREPVVDVAHDLGRVRRYLGLEESFTHGALQKNTNTCSLCSRVLASRIESASVLPVPPHDHEPHGRPEKRTSGEHASDSGIAMPPET